MTVVQDSLGPPEARSAVLRRTLVGGALLLAAFGSPALGADYSIPMPDMLRGPLEPKFAAPNYPRWDGFYFGGQAGQSFGNVNFGNASAPQISYILSNSELQDVVSTWTTLPQMKSSSASFGAFIGYNLQWEDVITGVEINYNHMAIDTSAADSIGPLIVNGANQPDGSTVQYSVIVNSSAALTIHDVVTTRLRFGWAFDRLLPYAFVGAAIGRVDSLVATNISVTKSITPPPTPAGPSPAGPFLPVSLPRNPQIDAKSQIAFGYTGGLGLEVGVTQNMFLRGEWEFVGFPSINDFRVQMNTVRAGVGLKF